MGLINISEYDILNEVANTFSFILAYKLWKQHKDYGKKQKKM